MSLARGLPFHEWGGYDGCRLASAAIGAGRAIVGLHGSSAAGSDDGGRGRGRETGRCEVTMPVLGVLGWRFRAGGKIIWQLRGPRRVKG